MGAYAVLGATSWGLTLARLLVANGHAVTVLVRNEAEQADVAARRGIARLPEVVLPPSVTISVAVTASAAFDGLVVAVPAQSVRANAAAVAALRTVPVLSAAKGIERATGALMSDVFIDAGWDPALVSVISGPNLAHEVARGLPAAAVVACSDEARATAWQTALSGGAFRVYRSDDVAGVEVGGALKNIIAIAAGAAVGMNFGSNAVATIMTRGLAEITRLGVALGAEPLTFQGLAGVGDLAATCFSPLSRNRRYGELLAAGRTAAQAATEIGEAVEGAFTAPVALALGVQHGVELPISEQVVAVVDGRATVPEAMAHLLSRALRPEASSGE
ncbi:MAG: NAD(P)-dependent glycerol-3-phosphate dehydrogenase [Chloroflexi bacterium]|nr:NAD(P)-dependent glycerol-3-phosphate dehydrogenase [Chloroflexota bacterium]